MGGLKRRNASLTIAIALSTPAQNPRGLANNIFIVLLGISQNIRPF